MNYSGFMGGLFALTEWIMRFFTINILWVITNLPVLLIVLLMIFSQSISAMVITSLPLIVLLPLIFFPSTTAVFANVRDWIMNKEYTSLFKSYWIHFKDNYKKSSVSGIILTFIWIVWVIDFYYFNTRANDLMVLLMVFVGLALLVFTINFFSLSVHYVMSRKELFKNTFYITIGKPLMFLFILVSNLLLFYVSITKALFLIPLFSITISAFLSFYAFFRLTLKFQGDE